MPESVIQRAFNAGELAPALAARADQTKYLAGLRTCRNMLVRRHGGVTKRPGTRFVAAVKDAAVTPRLLTFIFEGNDQTYVIEAGHLYLRFFWHGAPVVVSGVSAWSGATAYVVGNLASRLGVNYYCVLAHTNQQPPNATYWHPLTGTIYEIPTPWTSAQIARLQTTQSADVLTITHPSHVPYELRRAAHTTWSLVAFTTAPWADAPATPAGVAGAAGALTARYQVTAAKAASFEETYPSSIITIAASAPPSEALPNTLSWAAVTGAGEYYVYKDPYGNGIYGFLGVAATTAFNDVGFLPDFTVTPPVVRTLFAATNAYPSVCAYHKQRLWFAHTNTNPELVEGSQIGAFHNFSTSVPLQDDDAVSFVLASTTLNPVRHLLSLDALVLLTDGGEWVILGDEGGVITPISINAKQKGYAGASPIRPVVVGDSVIYVQARGTVVRDLAFDGERGVLDGSDLTIFAAHLFEGYSLVELAFARQPHSIIWAVRSDGTLLGMTYLKEHEVWGWHRHDTAAAGRFEAVAVVPDTTAGEDVTYVVVRRTINGSTVRYLERIEAAWNPETDDLEDAFYLDSGLTYDGVAVSTVTGLSHLEGQTVAVLADGVVLADGSDDAFVVTAGAVALGVSATVVQVGLAITPQIETLDLDAQGTSVRDKKKRVQSVTVLLEGTSRGMLAGPDVAHLVAERAEPWEDAADLVTGPADVTITTSWTETGRVVLRHTDPLPWTINGILPNLDLGG